MEFVMPKAAKTKKQTPWEKAGVSRSTFYREKSKKRTTRIRAPLGATPPAIHQPSAPIPEAPVVTVDQFDEALLTNFVAHHNGQHELVDGTALVLVSVIEVQAIVRLIVKAGIHNHHVVDD
jgi:hypothetical protein